MLLARAGEQELLRLRVAGEAQRKVLLEHLVDRRADLVLVGARLGLDGKRDRGLGQPRRRIENRRVLVAKSLEGGRLLQFPHLADVPGVQFGHRRARFPLHHLNVLQAFGRLPVVIQQRGVVLEVPRHHLEIADPPGEGVGQCLENEQGNRLVVRHAPLDFLPLPVRFAEADGGAALARMRNRLGQEIQDRFAADVVQPARGQHRKQPVLTHRFAQSLLQVLDGQRSLLEKLLHQRVVALGHHLHQLLVPFARRVGEFGGDLLHLRAAVAVGLVEMGLHRHQVHHAAEALFRADRQMHGHRAAPEHLVDRCERTAEIGQFAVHPADHERPRHPVFRAVVPHFFRHHLHPGHRLHQNQGRIGGTQ